MKTKCEYSGTLFIISRKYSFGFSKSALAPRYTSEGRLPLCNTSSEARVLPSEVRIENYSDRKFSKSHIFQSFSGNHFCPRFMVPCSLSAENIFGFSKSAPTPRYTILDSMFPPCNAILEGRLPLCNTSSEAVALPSEVRIENDSDRKFSKSIFFQNFSGNHFSPRFMVPCSLLAENKFFGSRDHDACTTKHPRD